MTPTLVLAAAFLAGLLLPPLARVPPEFVAGLLALALLLTEISRPVAQEEGLRSSRLLVFAALRFAILPPCLFAAAIVVVPDLAHGVGLLALVPVGVAAPTLTRAIGGDPGRSSVLLAVTTVLFMGWMLVSSRPLGVNSPLSLAAQVAAIALLPLALGGPARHAIRKYGLDGRVRYASHAALILVALTIAVVTARSWQLVSAPLLSLSALAGVAVLEFALFYLVAIGFCRVTGEEDAAAYIVSSGFNNNVLGAVLAAMHLSPLTALFMSASNPVCSLAFLTYSAWHRRTLLPAGEDRSQGQTR